MKSVWRFDGMPQTDCLDFPFFLLFACFWFAIFFCLLAKTIFPFSLKSTGGDVESILMD